MYFNSIVFIVLKIFKEIVNLNNCVVDTPENLSNKINIGHLTAGLINYNMCVIVLKGNFGFSRKINKKSAKAHI